MTDHPVATEDPYKSFDHLKTAAMECPEPLLRSMRESCPVGRSEEHGGFWVVTDHACVVEAARNTEAFSSSPELGPGDSFPFTFPFRIPMIESDEPEHREYRSPLNSTFGKANADSMEDEIRAIVTRLIDEFIEEGEADLATQLTTPVPTSVTAGLLDIPLDKRSDFRDWTQELVSAGSDSVGFKSLMQYIEELYSVRKEDPGDDLTSLLFEVELDGEKITREQWVGMVLLLIAAGLDTTSNGGALMFHYIASECPHIREDMIARPETLRSGIEEVLRLTSPVPQHSRGVQSEIDLGGTKLQAGDPVLLHWWAANRDEKVFPEADEYRPDRRPNRHIAFGSGPHRCLGANIARVELRVQLEEVLRRLPDYEVIDEGVERYPSLNRGMSHLPVRFTPGPREGDRA